MFINIENLELLSVLQCTSPARIAVADRPSHAFVFRRSGSIDYDFGNGHILQEPGQVMLLPKGCSFIATQVSQEPSHYTVVNFLGDFSLTEPLKTSPDVDLGKLYARLDRCCTLDPEQDRYLLLSDFYWIAAQLLRPQLSPYRSGAALHLLDPAVEYLRKHLFDPELSVGQLHPMCNISDTYFRALFAARFGMSPKKYILDRRLVQAKQLLDSGECAQVSEVARLCGFDDALYFSRAFKNRYGYPPTKNQVT